LIVAEVNGRAMGSKQKPLPPPIPAPPPVSATGYEAAQNALDARRDARKGFDWSKTINRSSSLMTTPPAGTKSTLG